MDVELSAVKKPVPAKKRNGERGVDKKPRAKPKPRTSNKPKVPGSKVIVKANDAIVEAAPDIVAGVIFEPYEGLNLRQSMFVNYYVSSLNATRAAERAGYSGEVNALGVIGHKLLRNAKIAKAIKSHYEDRGALQDEMTMRLIKISRGSFGPFLKIEDDAFGGKVTRLDLASEEAQDNHDLIREWDGKTIDKILSDGDGGDESALLVNQVHVKLHDPLKAMEILAKHFGISDATNPPPAPVQGAFTLNGNAVISQEATLSFLSKALGIPVEQIPITVDGANGGDVDVDAD
ncbi:MAG: terminase small subunit [Abditibacteriaceae bacterium]